MARRLKLKAGEFRFSDGTAVTFLMEKQLIVVALLPTDGPSPHPIEIEIPNPPQHKRTTKLCRWPCETHAKAAIVEAQEIHAKQRKGRRA